MNRRDFTFDAIKLACFYGVAALTSRSALAQCKKETTGGAFAEFNENEKKIDIGNPSTNVWEVGDCRMYHGAIVLRPDGSAYFVGNVKTEHTTNRDIFHLYILLQTAEGKTVHDLGQWDGPEMKEKVWMNWRREFSFNPKTFSQIQRAAVTGCC
jgi:hypothetical protein